MEEAISDDLLQEIIQHLPPSSFPSISLVSKRWLSALRSSTTILSLSLHPPSSLSSILSHYPHLHSLSIHFPHPPSPDSLLLAVASSPSSSRLIHLRFSTSPIPISPSALISSSSSFSRLTHLHLSSVFPHSFSWLAAFPFLKSLSLSFFPNSPDALDPFNEDDETLRTMNILPLETLSLSGLPAGDHAISWIWPRCGNLRRLRFRACEKPSSPLFPSCLPNLHELELRSCIAMADYVLLLAADRCRQLNSFLLHDGCSSEALLHFITLRSAGLRTIDLRLPLDLHNYHLSPIAGGSPGLSVLRLQSCCLVTGDGLRAMAGKGIEELGLVNCDVVEREPDLLCFLGQSLVRLRRLDLSFNETMKDKDLVAMLSSCSGLVEIKIQGCGKLTDAALVWMVSSSRLRLEAADLRRCPGISPTAIEALVVGCCGLRVLCVEKKKVSEATAMAVASRRGILEDVLDPQNRN